MYESDKISSLLQELAALPPISEENARKLDDKYRLEFNYNSNHIEGNTLTYGETKLLLMFDKTDGQHEMREFEEMKAHDVAYRWIKELAEDESSRLIEREIKQLNQIILVRPFWKEAITSDGQSTKRKIQVGEYKQHPNSVLLQNGEMFHYTSPIDTPMAMNDLMAWFHEETEKQELSPVELAAIFHYKFVRIHPFDDGNGRISRLLMNYVLLKNGLPPVIIKSADKKNYLNALNQADTGNLTGFIEYISQQLIWSLQIKLKATKGESIEEEDDIDKQVALFKREQLNAYPKKPFKTFELFLRIYKEAVREIIIQLDKRLIELDELFYSTASYFIVNYNDSDDFQAEKSFTLLEEIDKWLESINDIEKISWGRQFSGSINNKTSNTLISLVSTFQKRNFEIKLEKTEVCFEFPYAHKYTEAEIKEIVNKLYKGIFEIIQSNTKK
ncbi:Fic family protein [Emticicia sp. TH156]|uniref:Fic family protein n=1 Tax=Emticicia sp. TH156 TaxID=2067454 RepID=UPI000C78AE46|nr:Fic family protein [Emticicia sp. TH156]PLK44319.1 Fic family protein [Emticicia sp. TH156]